jgi:hypothetical protein
MWSIAGIFATKANLKLADLTAKTDTKQKNFSKYEKKIYSPGVGRNMTKKII